MNPELSLPFRPDIQGLRAIAVVLVLLAHAGVPGFAGGFVGVDVFFVLSGYLITGLLVNERLANGRIRYLTFVSRRLKRLLPALLCMLLVVLAVSVLTLSAFEARSQNASLAFSATWTSNLFFAFREMDYFDALQARDLYLHTWSLGVEEQFYLFWPMLIGLALASLGAADPDRARRRLYIVFGFAFVASLGLSLYWAATKPLLSFYMMPSRVWQFALGALVFVASNSLTGARPEPAESRPPNRWMVPAAGALGVVMITGSAVLLHTKLTYPGLYALVPSIGTALVIAAGAAAPDSAVSRVLARPAAVYVGDRSYSLYLWHWPVLVLAESHQLARDWRGVAASLVLAGLLAALSYRWVERPFWKGRFQRFTPARVIPASMAAMALVVVAVGGAVREPPMPASAAESVEYDPRQDAPIIYTAGFRCDTGAASADLEACGVGGSDAPHTVVLLGDSVGAQWVSLLPELFTAPEWRVVVLTKSACPVVDEDYFYARIGETYTVCSTWRERAIEHIESLAPDLVVAGSASSYPFTDEQWIEGTARILARIAADSRVALVAATPTLTFDGPSCLEKPRVAARLSGGGTAGCAEQLADGQFRTVAGFLETAASGFDNVAVLDFSDIVCPGNVCAARHASGAVVFRDATHLTNSFVMLQLAEFRRRLETFGMGPTALTQAVAER